MSGLPPDSDRTADIASGPVRAANSGSRSAVRGPFRHRIIVNSVGSRSRLRKFRDLQNSFFAGSAERALAARIINEIEGLHQVLERLLQRFRGRSH
jgi:hypothetical protein